MQKELSLFSEFKEPDRSVIALNSAIAYLALKKVKDLKEGIEKSLEVLGSGRPLELISRLRRENVDKDN